MSHYQLGGWQLNRKQAFEKNIFWWKFEKVLHKFLEHGSFYNFYNSREVLSEYLTVFENNFLPYGDLRQSRFKYSFTILNQEPTPRDGFAEITDSLQFMDNRLCHNLLSHYQLGGR